MDCECGAAAQKETLCYRDDPERFVEITTGKLRSRASERTTRVCRGLVE